MIKTLLHVLMQISFEEGFVADGKHKFVPEVKSLEQEKLGVFGKATSKGKSGRGEDSLRKLSYLQRTETEF